jgi:L-alanine-DL-glutamate epimerase-like enolase superfamily enzyme
MKISWELLEVQSAFPFKISRAIEDVVTRVWVRIESEGLEGWGEADPSPYYGETEHTVVAALQRMKPVIERSDDPFDLETLEAELLAAIHHNPSAHAAVTSALYDLLGKRLGEPLWKLWGLNPAAAPLSSFTIGMDTPEVVREKTRLAREYPILKVKVGTDQDEETLQAVRSESPDCTIRVDANAAWTAKEALASVPMLRDYGVEFIEQPLPPSDREGLRYLYEHSSIPIILDESCLVASDIPGLIGMADGINIKFAKCGGPREALRMIHTARACGLRVMMGCMLETTLGIAPAAHLAPLLDYADLDGAALLKEDPFDGPLLGPGGRIVLEDKPGLGVTKP